ncbi:MAG: M20/M25/M40 family metallo-hydrolase, partial [Candidatus Hodarchaeota archaeon]
EGVLAEMRQYIASLNLPTVVEVIDVPPYYNPYEIRRDERLLCCFEEAYEEIRGRSPILGYRPGITDANVFMGEGKIPTINFGPKGDQYHGADEYVETNSLLPVAKIQALTALKFIQMASF